jgi:hypothetical protein
VASAGGAGGKDNAAAGEAKADDHINLRVVSQDSNEVFFKIKRTTPLRKLMDAYCARNSLTADAGARNKKKKKRKTKNEIRKKFKKKRKNTRTHITHTSHTQFQFFLTVGLFLVRFLFDGTRLQPEKTPKEASV